MKTSKRIPVSSVSARRPLARRPGLVSLSTLSVLALAGAAVAQDKPAPKADDETVLLDTYVVHGVRASLIGAQEIKQNSVQVVDSVVAEDIGKFPDNTVADALQRIPGVQVGRSNGEVNSVIIRGLPNLGTTLNGNEVFTGTGRGLALQDIPAELVAGVDVFKSSAANKIEGGIAGLIDIRTRRPLDFSKPQFAAGLRFIRGENAEKTGQIGSVLVSDRNTTDFGEIGVLYAGAYQQRYFVDQIAFNFLFESVGVPTGLVPGQTTLMLPFTQGGQVIPGDRRRWAHDLSVQFKPNAEWEFYNDYLQTAYRDKHQVHFLIGFPRFGGFTAATVHPGTNIPITTTSDNNFHLTSTQAFQQRTDGYHNVLGAKWTRDNVKVTAEYLYNWNRYKNQVLIIDTRFEPTTMGTFQFTYDNNGRADLKITNADPTSAANYKLWGLFDNRDYSVGKQSGGKLEIEYALGDGFFRKVEAGLRYTKRDVRFRGSNRNDVAPVGATGGDRFAPTVPRTSTIPGFGSVNPDGPLSYYSTPHWYGADPEYLYNNAAAVRALFGFGPAAPNFDPSISFTDTETVTAGFVNSRFETKLGDLPLDGTAGFRVVRTAQDLRGYHFSGSPLDDSKSQTDVLPVLNTRLKLRDDLQLRFAAGRTITRPNFDQLNPATTLTLGTTTGGSATAPGSGSGGNPDLATVKSTNYDLSLEYYLSKSSYAALTAFYRSIDGYVQGFSATEQIDGKFYNVSRPRNAGKGHLKGLEASYQKILEHSALEGLGWQANFTYITGQDTIADTGAHRPYAQVSKYSYNLVGLYEHGKISARLAWNWRGKFTDTFDGPNAPGSPLRQIVVKATKTLDFSASYELNPQFTITFDATNILKSQYQDYFYDASLYPRDTRAYDRTLAVGVRYRY